MSFTQMFQLNYVEGNDSLTKRVDVEVDQVDKVSVTVAGTDHEVSVAFELAFLRGYYLLATVDMLLQTNNTETTAPGDTIELEANVPLVWFEGCGWGKAFTDNVERIYATNANPTDNPTGGTLEIRIGRDMPTE